MAGYHQVMFNGQVLSLTHRKVPSSGVSSRRRAVSTILSRRERGDHSGGGASKFGANFGGGVKIHVKG